MWCVCVWWMWGHGTDGVCGMCVVCVCVCGVGSVYVCAPGWCVGVTVCVCGVCVRKWYVCVCMLYVCGGGWCMCMCAWVVSGCECVCVPRCVSMNVCVCA